MLPAKILLIEDSRDDKELIEIAFRMNNIECDLVNIIDGEEAIDYIKARGKYSTRDPEEIPDLIMLDLQLPKINGIQVLKTIRTDRYMINLPVVIFSSSREESDLINCYQTGANSYIRKPVDAMRFNNAIRSIGNYWLRLNKKPNIS